MSTKSNNLQRNNNFTCENTIPEPEVEKTAEVNFNAITMPFSTDVKIEAEVDSNITEVKNVSSGNSNPTGISTTGSNSTSAINANQKNALDNMVSSMRTDRKLIHQINNSFKAHYLVSLGDSQIVQLSVGFALMSHLADNKNYRKGLRLAMKKRLFEDVRKLKERRKEERRLNLEIVKEAERLQDEKNSTVTFRIPDHIKREVKAIYHTDNFTFAINCCLIKFLQHLSSSKTTLDDITKSQFIYREDLSESKKYLFSRPGLKKDELLDIVTHSIEEMRLKFGCTTYIEPFTGTANVLLHLKTKFEHEEINDGEEAIINLLHVIQKYDSDFISELLFYPVKEATFDELKKGLENADNKCKKKSGKKIEIDNAVKFFYTMLLSYYGKGETFRKSAIDNTLLKKLFIILVVSKRLKDTKITKNDVFYFLNKIAKRKKEDLIRTVIYLDPPYIGTELYYDKSKKKFVAKIQDAQFHRKLKEKLLVLKEAGVKIVISYRATVTKKNAIGMNTETVQNILDELYQGFFIQFQKITHRTKINDEYIPDNQIEILLTSEQVEGSIPYNRNIADLIQKHVK